MAKFVEQIAERVKSQRIGWEKWFSSLEASEKAEMRRAWKNDSFFILSALAAMLIFNVVFLAMWWADGNDIVLALSASAFVRWVTWINVNAFLGYAAYRMTRESVEAALGQSLKRTFVIKESVSSKETSEERAARERATLIRGASIGAGNTKKHRSAL